MKIICVGHNYRKHLEEMNTPFPSSPTIFSKPDTAFLNGNKPFYIPEFSNDVQYETELVIKIAKNGKHIQEEFAHSYYKEVALGVDFTARDLQNQFKNEGKPWELCKGFDNSAPVSNFIPISSLKNPQNICFKGLINNKIVQEGSSVDMIFHFDKLICFISKYITLKMGDIIFTGTPSGVGTVKIGDVFTGYIEDNLLLNFKIK